MSTLQLHGDANILFGKTFVRAKRKHQMQNAQAGTTSSEVTFCTCACLCICCPFIFLLPLQGPFCKFLPLDSYHLPCSKVVDSDLCFVTRRNDKSKKEKIIITKYSLRNEVLLFRNKNFILLNLFVLGLTQAELFKSIG